jgi:hypothetical protein
VRVDHLDFERVEVALSERNLITLLNKVRREGSLRTLEIDLPVDDCGETAVLRLKVVAETDEEHYAGRDAPPGEVWPGDLLEPTVRREATREDLYVDQHEQPTTIMPHVRGH